MTRRSPAPPPPTDDTERDDVELYGDGEPFPQLNLYRETGDAAILADPAFNGWTWTVYRLRTSEEMARERTRMQRVWMTRVSGPLDVAELQASLGGGTFEIRGMFDGTMRARFMVEIHGVRKAAVPHVPPTLLPTDTPLPPASAPASPPPDDRIARLLELVVQGQQQTAALIAALGNTRQQADPNALTVKDVFEIAERMRERGPDQTVLGEIVSAFKNGMELRAQVEGGPERSTTEILVDKIMPAVERVATAMISRPAPAPRRPAAGPRAAVSVPASSATVVENPTPPPLAPDPPPAAADEPGEAGNHRMATAIEALARAIERGDEPGEFAITLEAILADDELDTLRSMPDEQVVTVLRQSAGGELPALKDEAAAAFIAATLAELRSEPPE